MRNFFNDYTVTDISDLGIQTILLLDNLQKGDLFELSGISYEMGNIQKDGFTWIINGKRKKVYFYYFPILRQ